MIVNAGGLFETWKGVGPEWFYHGLVFFTPNSKSKSILKCKRVTSL